MASQRARTLILIVAALALATAASAQTKRKRPTVTKKTVVPAAVQPTPQPDPVATPEPPRPKRNERPNVSASAKPATAKLVEGAQYRYEFSQPDFLVSKIVIEHDDSGRGTISFKRRESDEAISDPIELSPVTLERIRGAYAALNFLGSSEDYQYERDYSHLGNSTFTLKDGGKDRTAKFNFTQNKDAKVLADEYRKLGQQFVWIFDITVARENQPLEAPRLLDSLDALMRRNEISDPAQMKNLLAGLVDDERIPLIARNHATRLIQRIDKGKK